MGVDPAKFPSLNNHSLSLLAKIPSMNNHSLSQPISAGGHERVTLKSHHPELRWRSRVCTEGPWLHLGVSGRDRCRRGTADSTLLRGPVTPAALVEVYCGRGRQWPVRTQRRAPQLSCRSRQQNTSLCGSSNARSPAKCERYGACGGVMAIFLEHLLEITHMPS